MSTPRASVILVILALINMLNFFDRTIIAVVFEPIRKEFGLNDLQLGIAGAAFTVVYAVAGIPLGRIADTSSRKNLLGIGLTAWSLLTAASGLVWNYISLLLVRMGLGIGEASCAPAATSMIGDLYPAEKRARAMGVFMLGLPIGLVLAFFTIGPIVQAFGSWRAPFFAAAVPGLILAIVVFLIREPQRGASEKHQVSEEKIDKPVRKILSIKTMWWIILSGVSVNFAAYAGNGFLVALLLRYYQLPIADASIITGGIVGVTGLIGLTLGGHLSDSIHKRSETGRLTYGAVCLLIASIAIFAALKQGQGALTLFSVLFGLGWLTYYSYYTTVYPALQDVVQPKLRGTAMALYFAGMYLLGGAFGTVVVGGLSDYFANAAMIAEGVAVMNDTHRAIGLHDAMYLIPVAMLITAVFVFLATKTFKADHKAMLDELER
ncbi:MFS transporter [Alteromonadaceae bacterium M269]|nr:MFS transporter [Alteromonadaceae bacterium M269]